MLIIDGIHLLEDVKGAHCYLVTGSNPFIIDTGFPGQEAQIIKYLQKVGVEPQSLQGIILTHFDLDHVGSVVALQKNAQCPIYAHPIEIPYILGNTPRPGMKNWFPILMRPLLGELVAPEHIEALEGNNPFQDWEIIHTPGHTPGHIILYRNGIAIVGDLLQGGQIRLAPTLLTWKKPCLIESVNTLITRPLRWILPGHGPVTPASIHWLDQLINT
ncbi:MAG: MBL fold metallo-hydrolase [Desulfitobacteriaceae bacterium]